MTEYIATDGTIFTKKSEYRKYEMATQYTFRSKQSQQLTKLPGSVLGQPFNITDCKDCTILILDHVDQVQIDNVSNSKVFIGASSGSVFIRHCHNCTFTVACKQLRTRDCNSCTLNLYSKTEPIIESSQGMKFAPFNGAYPGHDKAMDAANLDPKHNLWYAVYDFNDELKSNKNWCILNESDEDGLWCPLGPAKNVCPRITLPGAKEEPSTKSNAKGDLDNDLCEVSLETDNDDDLSDDSTANRSLKKGMGKNQYAKKNAIGPEYASDGSQLVNQVKSLFRQFYEMFLTGITLSSLPSKAALWVDNWKDILNAFFQKRDVTTCKD